MDGGLGMMPTPDMVEVYRRIKKPSIIKGSKREHTLGGVRGAKPAAKNSGRQRSSHSRRSSEALGREAAPPALGLLGDVDDSRQTEKSGKVRHSFTRDTRD